MTTIPGSGPTRNLRLTCRRITERDEDTWLNIWRGFPRQNLDGAVFAKELRKAQTDGRITAVPYDREIPVDTFWDLGFFDQTVVWMAQRVAAQWRVLDCLIVKQTELSAIIKTMQRKEFVYGQHFLPHDGKAKKLGMKHTIQEQLDAGVAPACACSAGPFGLGWE